MDRRAAALQASSAPILRETHTHEYACRTPNQDLTRNGSEPMLPQAGTCQERFSRSDAMQRYIARSISQIDTQTYAVLLHGAVIASKTAVNGVLAARAASSIALNKLDRDPGLVARTCTCRTAGMGKAERDVDQFLSEFKA